MHVYVYMDGCVCMHVYGCKYVYVVSIYGCIFVTYARPIPCTKISGVAGHASQTVPNHKNWGTPLGGIFMHMCLKFPPAKPLYQTFRYCSVGVGEI